MLRMYQRLLDFLHLAIQFNSKKRKMSINFIFKFTLDACCVFAADADVSSFISTSFASKLSRE